MSRIASHLSAAFAAACDVAAGGAGGAAASLTLAAAAEVMTLPLPPHNSTPLNAVVELLMMMCCCCCWEGLCSVTSRLELQQNQTSNRGKAACLDLSLLFLLLRSGIVLPSQRVIVAVR